MRGALRGHHHQQRGRTVAVRTIGEQHVTDDLGWMGRTPFRPQTEENMARATEPVAT